MYRMVFAQILRRIVYILAGSLLASCTAYRTFQVEMLQPSQIVIEPGKQIGLLERNMMYERGELKAWLPDKLVAKMDLFEQFAIGMKSVMVESWETDSLITLAEAATTVLSRPMLPVSYPVDSVQSLCRKFNLDYIVSIELPYCENIDRHISCNWLVRLYSKIDTIPIDSVVLTYRLGVPENYDNIEEFVNEILGASWDAGAAYTRRIMPSWKTGERRIYNKGKILQLGDVFFKEGDIEKAMKLWEGAWNMSANIAVKAGVNLAWIYENIGDYEDAIGILTQTEAKIKGSRVRNAEISYLQKYIKLLSQRTEENKLLEKQINAVQE